MENNIKTYKDLIKNEVHFDGYYNSGSSIEFDKDFEACNENSMVAKSEKIAKSMKAMAMISQLMPYYGGEITEDEWLKTIPKYSIIAGLDGEKNIPKIVRISIFSVRSFLSFHTPEQRDEFLKNNEDLIKEYLMIK